MKRAREADSITGGRMTLVDGLRAIAALVVILPHAWVLFRDVADRPGVMSDAIYFVRVQGTLGVQVFFVLSGFVIAYSLRDVRVTAKYFGRFVLRRSIRLDPPYWVGLIVCCGVLWFGRSVAQDGSRLPSPKQLLLHLAYLQQFAGCNDAINHTYWTLCQEVQMYLAFCGALGLLQLARVPYRPVLAGVFLVSLGWPLALRVPGGIFTWSVRGLFLPQGYAFLAGAVSWWTVEGTLPRWTGPALATVAIMAAARHGDVPIWVVTVTATLLAVAGRRGSLQRWLNHRPMQALGRASYGLYLLHNPVISLVLILQRRLGWNRLPGDFAMLAVVMVASVVAAWGMHIWVEKPCLRLARRLRPEPRGLPLIPS